MSDHICGAPNAHCDTDCIGRASEHPSSNKGLAEFLRTKADGAGADDAALFGLCARVIEASDEPPALPPRTVLPGCMMPDGADPCDEYQRRGTCEHIETPADWACPHYKPRGEGCAECAAPRASQPPHVTQEVQNVLAWLRTVELVCYARDDRQSVIYIGQARALLHRLSRASEPPPAARDEHDESGRTGVFRNCGYVGTACGWIVRDGTYWVATFRGDVDASQYVAFRNAPPPPKSRKCAADMYADPPRDCDAPFCGCNPAWDQCIQMLQECNLLVDRKARVMSCGEAGAVGKSETPTGGVCTQTPGPGSIPGTAQPPHQGMEEVDASELTVDAIRKRAAAFNHWFRTNGGFKGYEAQAIDVLLGRIDALEVPAEPPSVEAGKCNSSHIPMGGQNFIPPAVEKPARQVGCEGDDGLLRVHSEEERCDVCLHTRDVHTRRYRCMGCDKDVAECTCGRAGETGATPSPALRDSAENFAREMTLAVHGPEATEEQMRRVATITCESMKPPETSERAKRLDAAAATGNVEHYTAVVQSMIDDEFDGRGKDITGCDI